MTGFSSPAPLLPEVLALHGKWRGNKDAVVCDEERLNWAAFSAANHRFAHGLLARDIAPGDRVGIVMANGLPMVQALFGTMAAGAASVPINLSVNDDAMLDMLEDSGVRALVVSEDQQPRLDALRDRFPASVVLTITAGQGSEGWLAMSELEQGQPATLPPQQIDDNSPLNIIYSSGTTGLPKGILHSHRGRRDWAYDLAIALRYHGAARALLTIGLYSNISWVAMLCTLLAGGTIVVHRRFDADEFLDTVTRERITHTAMVPVQFRRVIESQRGRARDVSSMHSMMSCGSPLHEGLKRDLFGTFRCGVIELYGLTEGIITTLDPEDAAGRWSSVGKPLLGTDICIVGDDNTVQATNSSGEIVSRGRITMPGYWRRDEANHEAEFVDESGVQWLRSGDIGYLDDEGYLFIVDRKKDMILSGGQNIYPQDVEAVLVEHPDVTDVAVIGAPSARWGETPVALVVRRDAEVDCQEILAWANERLGRQQRLADVLPIVDLPRNPNGKILKRELRKAYGDLSYE